MNTVTTSDVAETAMAPQPAYDFFGNKGRISAITDEEDPVGSFGLRGIGMGDIMTTLQGKWLGLPVWAWLAGGAALVLTPPGKKILSKVGVKI